METSAKLYSLPFGNVKTYLFVLLFVAGNIALPQLCHLVPAGGPTLLPIYFFTLIAAYKYGFKVGLLMNLPVSTLRRICEKVIAVNVSPLMATKYKMNIVSIALRSYNFMFRSNSFPEREKADLLIEPYNLEGYSNTELEKAEEIFMQGYNTTNDILERLLIDKGSIWKE